MKVSYNLLRRKGACIENRKRFKELFPERGGVEVTRANLELAHAAGISIGWFENLLPYGTDDRARFFEYYHVNPLPSSKPFNDAYSAWRFSGYYDGPEYVAYNNASKAYAIANRDHTIGCILYALGIEDKE